MGDTREVQRLLESWGYLAVFILTVLESACIPIPSEVTLGLGGALASGAVIGGAQGHLNLGLVIVAGIAGSVCGSLLAYVVGRTGGRALVDRRLYLPRSELMSYGGAATSARRLFPGNTAR